MYQESLQVVFTYQKYYKMIKNILWKHILNTHI